jgi:phenylacetate-CoA ligase
MAKEEDRDRKVQEIVALAYEHSPAMTERMRAANIEPQDIQQVADLAKLPVLSKDELVRMQAAEPPFGGMLAVDQSDLKWIFISPGPIYEGISDDAEATRSVADLLAQVGFTGSDVVLNAMSYHLVPFGILFDGGLRQLGATVLPTGVGNTELQVKMLLDHRATGYIGTPSFLMALLKKIDELGATTRLSRALVTAEPLPPSLREALEGYGLALINIYGTAELGAVGHEFEGGKGFQLNPDVIIQICDPESGDPLPDGELGEIVATNFNRAYPLIRFGTGDLSKIDPSSGNLAGWLGRSGEAVKIRGMFLHPLQLGGVLGKFEAVSRFQAVINRIEHRDEFVLRLQLADPEAESDELIEAVLEAVPSVCRVRPDAIEFAELDEEAPPILDERTWE